MRSRLLPRPHLARDRRGMASVEFVIVAPLMIAMLLATVDFGNMLYTRARLGAAVAAGAGYGIARVRDISTATATEVARSTATLVADTTAVNYAEATVTVNNGPVGTKIGTSAATATTTTAATTNGLCYCPISATNLGTAQACKTSCANGGVAGRFVLISARRSFTPTFNTFGLTNNGFITVATLVQVE